MYRSVSVHFRNSPLTLLHSEWSKFYGVLAVQSAIGLGLLVSLIIRLVRNN